MKKNRKKIVLIFTSVLFLLFIANKTFFFKKGFLENFAGNITYPFIWTTSTIASPIKRIIIEIKRYSKLQYKNKIIKKENKALLKENIQLKALLHFAIQNNELLDFKKRYELNDAIFAQVLVKNITDNEHYILVNKGIKHGIKKNMIAIEKFQILGKVTDVYRWYSKILLITDRTCKISAFTNSTNASGICCGQNNIKSCKFEYVNHLSQLVIDDFIISSGQGLIFPEGFCLGKIKNFTKNNLYYDIDIEPLIDFDSLENCLITNQEKMSIY